MTQKQTIFVTMNAHAFMVANSYIFNLKYVNTICTSAFCNVISGQLIAAFYTKKHFIEWYKACRL